MKTPWIKALVLSVCFAVPTTAIHAGGIPVIDLSNLVQAVYQVQEMLNQLKELKNQLKVAEDQLDSLTGDRGKAALISEVYDNNFAVDAADIQAILNSYGVQDDVANGLSGPIADLFNGKNLTAAELNANAKKYLQASIARFAKLQTAITNISASNDPKAIYDLQARIMAEETMLNNERLKLEMLQATYQSEQLLDQQRSTQIRLNAIQSTDITSFSITPPTGSGSGASGAFSH
ncbi:MAG: hypothetical protein KDD54_11440 [Flavobacteriales bacterium]|nr:hypothetical protein [Flavobacteriales bacterium]